MMHLSVVFFFFFHFMAIFLNDRSVLTLLNYFGSTTFEICAVR